MQRMFYHPFEILIANNSGENRRYFHPSHDQILKFCEETTRWAATNGMRITSITPITSGVAFIAGHAAQQATSATCGVIVLCEPISQPPFHG